MSSTSEQQERDISRIDREPAAASRSTAGALKRAPWHVWLTVLVVTLGIGARASFLGWDAPWTPHQADEVFLPQEALALWEGVTPRELGWPASTARVMLSAAAAGEWVAGNASAAWTSKEPYAVLDNLAHWIAARYLDPTPMYRLGRGLSLLVGALQLLFTAWAIRRWFGPSAVLWATMAAALSPIAVAYSQYVLADIHALLCATIVVGLAATPTAAAIVAMSGFVGLAIASKFHFGLWLLTPLLLIWMSRERTAMAKAKLTLTALAVCAAVVLAFVPWFWINPLLAVKEFAAVVLFKVNDPDSTGSAIANAARLLGAIGLFGSAGALLGLVVSRRQWRGLLPVVLPVAGGGIALAGSAIVFERYALVLLPGILVLAATGWDRTLAASNRRFRLAGYVAAGACLALTAASLVRSQHDVGQTDVDVQATRWITAHVPRGARVAVHDESVAPLPRDRGQLRECIDRLDSLEAYRNKWRVEGIEVDPEGMRPMESVLLNDERFYRYWCLRELSATTDAGFHVVPYHRDPRFWSVLERDAIEDFRTGGAAKTGGLDVLVVNRELEVGIQPAHVVATGAGRRLIYIRAGLSTTP